MSSTTVPLVSFDSAAHWKNYLTVMSSCLPKWKCHQLLFWEKNLLTSFPVSNVNSKSVFSNWSSNRMKPGLAHILPCQHLSGLFGTISAASCAACTPYKRISLPLLLHNKQQAGTAKWSTAPEWHFCTKILGAIIESFRGEEHGNSLHRLHWSLFQCLISLHISLYDKRQEGAEM